MRAEPLSQTADVSAAAATLDYWIGGRRVPSSGVRSGEVRDPATGLVTLRVPFASAADLTAAIRAASDAFTSWRQTTPASRARILSRFRDLVERDRDALAAIIVSEHGKTFADAVGSVQRGIEVIEFAAGIPHLLKGEHARAVGRQVDTHSRRQPVGVCAGITPFNFPAMVPLWMFPMAIACGNTFVLKPSEKVPSTSMRLAELFAEAGLPDGVLNVVHGDGETVDALLADPGISAVSFVGSTHVARHVYARAAQHGKRVQALGGAKNHAVVLPDADIPFAADALIGAAFGSAGQRCMAISVVVAVGAAGDALVRALAARAQRLRMGPGSERDVDMGPVITREHRARVIDYIVSGRTEGAQLVLDGRATLSGDEPGYFIGPTLFDHVTPGMRIYRDEIFGPVLSVVRVASLDAAIALVNANPYGNGTALFTSSGAAARRFEEEIEVGMVGINVPIPVPAAFFSFGGWKDSLFGDLHVYGPEAIAFYTRTKVVTERWPSDESRSSGASLSMPTLE